MIYFWIKIIHVISSAVLFGTALGSAFYMLSVNQQKNIALIARATKQVVFVDWVFTGTSAVIQFITGIFLVGLKGYSPMAPWLLISTLGYLFAGVCWIVIAYLRICCRDLAFDALKNNVSLPKRYYRYYKARWILDVPVFLSLLVVFYFMVNK